MPVTAIRSGARRAAWWRPLVAAAAAIALMIAGTTGVLATFPGRNGPIVYMEQDGQGMWQIWTSTSKLTHRRQLTALPANSGWPVWSPDMRRIAFESEAMDADHDNDPFVDDIFTMKPDGTDVRKLTDSVGYAGGTPAWSPDGRLIAFEADRGDYPAQAGIYVMNSRDGSHIRRITTLPPGVDWDGAPRFSPDGKRLLFTRFRNGIGSAVMTIKLDGSKVEQLTPWELNAGDADWSPDGRLVVFEAGWVNGRADSWIVRSDGTGLRNLTWRQPVAGRWDGFNDPAFSPDGRSVMVGHGLHFDDGTLAFGLSTIRVDGSQLRFIEGAPDESGFEHQWDWGQVGG